MEFNFLFNSELLDTPHMKKIQQEDELLCQLTLDHALVVIVQGVKDDSIKATVSDVQDRILPEFDDIFTDSMRPVCKEGKVPCRSVFAARALLDVHDVVPDFNGVLILH
jgi:hypothetical protein